MGIGNCLQLCPEANFAAGGRQIFFLYLRTGKKEVLVRGERKKPVAKNNEQWLALFK